MSRNEFELDVVSVKLVKSAKVHAEDKIKDPESAIRAVGELLKDADREVVGVINLASDGTPINLHIVSIGTLNATLVEPREMLKSSILSNAARMIMVHNHPSGDMMPSKEDIMITDRMAKICTMVGIPLIEHVIVGDDNHSYFSFKEKGMVEYKGSIRYETDLKHIHLDKVAERSMKDDEVHRR